FDAKLRQIAKRPVVDTDHWHIIIADHPRSADHRPVAAEHDDQINARRESLRLDNLHRTSCLALNTLAIKIRRADQLDAVRVEPLDEMAGRLERLRLIRFDDHADATNRYVLHESTLSVEMTRRARVIESACELYSLKLGQTLNC